MSLFSASSQQEVGAAKALLCRNNFPLSRQKVMWFSRPSDPPPDEALDADEREEVRSQAEEMGASVDQDLHGNQNLSATKERRGWRKVRRT